MNKTFFLSKGEKKIIFLPRPASITIQTKRGSANMLLCAGHWELTEEKKKTSKWQKVMIFLFLMNQKYYIKARRLR